ncbi:MAG TPA: DNA recombination protein RmuC [Tepidisphaeraceae bacterium]|nr:DNA recombination protein RmuC [Tepidisphaeraceae bacterium]
MMSFLAGIIGLVVGGVIAYLLAERRFRAQLSESHQKIAVAEETLHLRQEAEVKLRETFTSLSADALAKNNEAFLNLAREKFATLSAEATGSLDERKAQIEGLLKPMQEVLNQYQTRLGDIEKSRVESYSMLREQLGTLAETQRTLNLQTTQLVSALRRPHARGQWGEVALRRLVELAGMTMRCDFVEQHSVNTEDSRQRPDMIVNLPGKRQIIIDCKAVLDGFLDATTAPDEETRRAHIARHCKQVRSRAMELSTKAYWSQFQQSPEYVVMFLPGEAFLYAAVEHDGSLIEDCLKNRVIVATPTTLIALLKAIEFGWRQEQVAHNAEEVRKLGTELYERLVILANHFSKLGSSIDQSVKVYNDLLGSLESRVLVTGRKMGELGAKSTGELPELEPIDRQTRELSASLRNESDR